MTTIFLDSYDPIIQKANQITHIGDPTEIGLIPGDVSGCKIYAYRQLNGELMIYGAHLSMYGCDEPGLFAFVQEKVVVNNPSDVRG